MCALIGLLLLVTSTLATFSPAVSYIIAIIGFFTLVVSICVKDLVDVHRIAGVGLLALAAVFFMFALNPDPVPASGAQVKNPGGEAVCGYSEENPCTVRHLKTFFYSLFWR